MRQGLRGGDWRAAVAAGMLPTATGLSYQVNSPLRRNTRGFMYVVGVSQPVVVGEYA